MCAVIYKGNINATKIVFAVSSKKHPKTGLQDYDSYLTHYVFRKIYTKS